MTFREKLADWISGGALTYEKKMREMWKDGMKDECKISADLRDAMRAIIAQETPSANSTVKRMVGIARLALTRAK